MKIVVIVVVALIAVVSLVADYKWRRWMAARQCEHKDSDHSARR